MALNYAYAYAQLDLTTNRCIGVFTATNECDAENLVEIPAYDEEYFLKYYIDGNWYEDAAGTIPWTSSLA